MGFITILLMPNFNQTRKELGYDAYEDYDSDAVRYQQGYNIQKMTVEDGEEFIINKNWESATIHCNGKMIKLITNNEWEDEQEDDEQIGLTSGIYLLHDGGIIIEKLNKEIDDNNNNWDQESEGIF